MTTMLSRAAKKIIHDAGVTFGILGDKNSSQGSAEQIGHFYNQADYVYMGKPILWEHEHHIIKTYLPPPPARILDVGCGGGRTTVCLSNLGYDIVGVDLSERLITWATNSFPGIDFRVMNAGELVFDDNSFDAAIFSHNGLDCIAPVAARLKVLREILRVVRPGGRFYLSSHNIWGKLIPAGKGLYGWVAGGYDWTHRLLRQILKLNFNVFSGYWWYYDVDGWQCLYSASPRKSIHLLNEAGWNLVAVLGRDLKAQQGLFGGSSEVSVLVDENLLDYLKVHEHHVQFVLEKANG